MLYIWDNHSTLNKKTGGSKARTDASRILKNLGAKQVVFHNTTFKTAKAGLFILNYIQFPLIIKPKSILFIQYPFNAVQRLILKSFKKYKKIHTIYLIHDLESIRLNKDKNIELNDLNMADSFISLNQKLTDYMKIELATGDKPVVNLDLWDYLPDDTKADIYEIDLSHDSKKFNMNILIAGNLSSGKAAYLNKLSEINNIRFFLMGDNLDNNIQPKGNVIYLGSFNANTKVNFLGGELYGLVWDGNSIDTCSGSYGEYLKYNLPHKTSFYLSNNIPIVIWKHAAIFDFLNENRIAIGIESLFDLNNINLNTINISTDNLRTIQNNVKKGYYLSCALQKLDVS
ncbi:hypothetical protein [Psychrobacter sanguinis]|uniref:hypothetical protein n=1 Tax=Psychrobacter sanguinis TaxID=861445 RepID=UPI0028AE3BF7|nr:hypothetical protein [Psychrobacter sanguinis]